ncbi:MAG: phage shock protein PspA [Deltaproteobacteria bacterium]|nr:phage shock protein PspA [Deltaproteobacteria bacterium]
MGVFTRFRDIVSSNINAMLDKAEDPEKMIKLMIREMEDTLVELKASCAGIMAEKKKIQRRLEEMQSREELWSGRARMAVDKGRDDLAREALIEKKRFKQMTESLEQELIDNNALVNQYHDDIRQLEDKLGKAREKQRILVQRSIRARQAKQAQEEIRRVDNYETIAKFDELENRIERMEAEADLVNFGRKPDLEEEFEELMVDDDIERELASLKTSETEPEKNSASER